MVDFWIEMGSDANGMCCNPECKFRPASCLSRDISTVRLEITMIHRYLRFCQTLNSLYRYSDIHRCTHE